MNKKLLLSRLRTASEKLAKSNPFKSFNISEETNEFWTAAADDPRYRAFTHSSSFVGNVQYDRATQEMSIILNGKTYDFCGVPERVYDAFEGSNSKGAYFNRVIKKQFDC